MSNYDNTNRGQIWKNDKKESDKHPDFKGEGNINGVDFWIAAWKRAPDANPKAPPLRFSFTPKDAQKPQSKPQQAAPVDDFDDDIPF